MNRLLFLLFPFLFSCKSVLKEEQEMKKYALTIDVTGGSSEDAKTDTILAETDSAAYLAGLTRCLAAIKAERERKGEGPGKNDVLKCFDVWNEQGQDIRYNLSDECIEKVIELIDQEMSK